MSRVPGEFDLIHRYFAPLASGEAGAFNLGDDAALFKPTPGHNLVVTADTLVEGVHYLPGDPPGQIAKKALRVNLSDLASMGATPKAYTLALALGRGWNEEWVADFAAGLADDQKNFGVTVIGGDTVSAPGAATINITAIGEVGEGRALTRAGACDGDDIWVTGTIGDAGLGLQVLKDELSLGEDALNEAAITAYRLPEPRVAAGINLGGVATSAVDISDGLIADLGHICEQSAAGALVELAAVPLSHFASKLVTADQTERIRLITSGDDYELCFTAPPSAESWINKLASEVGVSFSKIGRIETGSGVRVMDTDGNMVEIPSAGYQHF